MKRGAHTGTSRGKALRDPICYTQTMAALPISWVPQPGLQPAAGSTVSILLPVAAGPGELAKPGWPPGKCGCTHIHGDGAGGEWRAQGARLTCVSSRVRISPSGSVMKRTGENRSQSNTPDPSSPDPSSGWTPGTTLSPGWWDGEGRGLHTQLFPMHLPRYFCPFS